MRGFGRGASLYEDDVEEWAAEVAEVTAKPRFHLTFWVKRGQEHGGNLQGDCTGYELHRSGALTIFVEGGKRHVCAPGTWADCVTETKR